MPYELLACGLTTVLGTDIDVGRHYHEEGGGESADDMCSPASAILIAGGGARWLPDRLDAVAGLLGKGCTRMARPSIGGVSGSLLA